MEEKGAIVVGFVYIVFIFHLLFNQSLHSRYIFLSVIIIFFLSKYSGVINSQHHNSEKY